MQKKSLLIATGVIAAGVLVYVVVQGRRDAGPGDPSPGADTAVSTPERRAKPETEMTAEKPPSPYVKPEVDPRSLPVARPTEPDPRVTQVGDKVHLNVPLELARAMHRPDSTPEEDLHALGNAVGYYRLVYKENPVGSLNEEIVAQLTGENPEKAVFLPPDHPDINGKGQIIDRWGTPYFFHALSSKQMDVWSAGPDQDFGTDDDLRLGDMDSLGDPELGLNIDDEG